MLGGQQAYCKNLKVYYKNIQILYLQYFVSSDQFVNYRKKELAQLIFILL